MSKNEFNILWIDDDWANPDSLDYQNLSLVKGALEDRNKNIRFEIEANIVRGFIAIQNLDSGKIRFDLIIIDLNFGEMNEGIWSDLVTMILNKKNQFAIYTYHRNKYNDDLAEVRKKCRDYLIDIYDKSDSERFIDEIIQISEFTPITFVHLSDFHYDSTIENSRKKNQEMLFDNLIEFISEEHKNTPIDFFIFSGDFAAKNPLLESKQVATLLRKIISVTNNDLNKLLLVPGNHDVNWNDFEKGVLAEEPGLPSKMLYEEIFGDSKDFFNKLSGHSDMGLDTKNLDSLCFSKKYKNGQINILGLNSVSLDPKLKGCGSISEKVIKYIKNKWREDSALNEFRITTFHHNVLPSFSENDLDENQGITNAGKIIELLTNQGCDLLLNGHCHFSGLYNFSFSSLNHSGYSEIKQLTTLSTGTTGGYAPQYDRARSFNIIRIYPTTDRYRKSLKITPVIYDSTMNKWIKCNELQTEISKSQDSTIN